MNVAQLISDTGAMGEQLTSWAVVAIPNVVGALLILFFGWWIAGRLSSAAISLLIKQGQDDHTLLTMLAKVVRYAVLVIAMVAALSQLGIETTSILAALGAIGLAIGLALQKTLSNIAAGVMLLWLRPFSIGNFIEFQEGKGKVEDIGLFATSMTTVDGLYVFVPNSEIWNKKIVNYSKRPTRMIKETMTISYDDDVETARKVLLRLLSTDERIHKSPEPIVKVEALGDSSVELEVRAWTNTTDFAATRWDVIERAKQVIEAEGLSIPYPQQDVHIRGLPDSLDGSREPRLMPAGPASGSA